MTMRSRAKVRISPRIFLPCGAVDNPGYILVHLFADAVLYDVLVDDNSISSVSESWIGSDCFTKWKRSRQRHRVKCPCPNCNKGTDNFMKLFISCDEDSKSNSSMPRPTASPTTTPSNRRRHSNACDPAEAASSSSRPRLPVRSSNRRSSSPGSVGLRADRPIRGPTSTSDPPRSSSTIRAPVRSSSSVSPTTIQPASNVRQLAAARSPSTTPRLSLGRRLSQSKHVKELRVVHEAISQLLLDSGSALLSIHSLEHYQQVKSLQKLKSSHEGLALKIEDHKMLLESLSTDCLGRNDRDSVRGMKQGLAWLSSSEREQWEMIHCLFLEKVSEENARVCRMKEEQKRLKETLLDYGGVLKSLPRRGNSGGGGQGGRRRRKLLREHEDLSMKVHGLSSQIRTVSIASLDRNRMKMTFRLERELRTLWEGISVHGTAIQSVCSSL
eukprot:scaffold858_cov123-Cylindrotheca_fusiformis.AAC.34